MVLLSSQGYFIYAAGKCSSQTISIFGDDTFVVIQIKSNQDVFNVSETLSLNQMTHVPFSSHN